MDVGNGELVGGGRFSRRRFLVVGIGGAAGLVAVAGGVTARSPQSSPPRGFALLFGDRTPAVVELGRLALAEGIVPQAPVELLTLLPAGVQLGERGSLQLTEPSTFARGLGVAVASELAAGELSIVGGFPLTVSEAATCAACALAAA